jgi:hypothetical protein
MEVNYFSSFIFSRELLIPLFIDWRSSFFALSSASSFAIESCFSALSSAKDFRIVFISASSSFISSSSLFSSSFTSFIRPSFTPFS